MNSEQKDPQTHAIIGAAMEAHRHLGPGFLEAQLLNYLKATRLERGMLLNFGPPSLEFKRFVFSLS